MMFLVSSQSLKLSLMEKVFGKQLTAILLDIIMSKYGLHKENFILLLMLGLKILSMNKRVSIFI